jgi:hypothetical protein
MAPEQIMGENLTLQADLFAFGTCLWELATEKIPHYNVTDSMEALKQAVCVHGLYPKLPGPPISMTIFMLTVERLSLNKDIQRTSIFSDLNIRGAQNGAAHLSVQKITENYPFFLQIFGGRCG